MEIDLHGLELAEAIIEVFYALEECKTANDSVLEIIHGYNTGSVLKNYFRSKKFIAQSKREGFQLKQLKPPNPGTSRFKIA